MIGKCMDLLPGYTCKWKPQALEMEAAEKFGFDFATALKEENCNN